MKQKGTKQNLAYRHAGLELGEVAIAHELHGLLELAVLRLELVNVLEQLGKRVLILLRVGLGRGSGLDSGGLLGSGRGDGLFIQSRGIRLRRGGSVGHIADSLCVQCLYRCFGPAVHIFSGTGGVDNATLFQKISSDHVHFLVICVLPAGYCA
jgi:hypothetical protein